MKIAIGADGAGFPLKEVVKKHLIARGEEVLDFGTDSEKSVHYPGYAHAVSECVVSGGAEFGILICGTGIGMSIAANKVKGVRAACVSEHYSTRYTRLHNDANIICLGSRVIGPGLAVELVDLFLETKPEGGRHAERIRMIQKIEEGTFEK